MAKTGTSFATTLIHHSIDTLPIDAHTREAPKGMSPTAELVRLYPVLKPMLWHQPLGDWGNHQAPNEAAWSSFNGSFFAMLRDPGRRAWSSYNYFCAHRRLCNGSAREYALSIAGSQTLQLAGQRDGSDCIQHFRHTSRKGLIPYTCRQMKPNLPLALKRLSQLAFVGLTDYWHRSICLFHLKFGTPCLPVELRNMRPTRYAAGSTNFDTPPGGFSAVDVVDSVLYSHAQQRFWREVHLHNATEERCARVCPPSWARVASENRTDEAPARAQMGYAPCDRKRCTAFRKAGVPPS